MVEICCLYAASDGKRINLKNNMLPRRISSMPSLNDILCLHEMFLAKGFHSIEVADILQGRVLIHNFLESMHYFHNISYLAQQDQEELDSGWTNIFAEVTDYCGNVLSLNAIEEYFLEHYCADFVWVELSDHVVRDSLFGQIVYIMHILDIAHTIPVVAISYQP